MNSLMISIQMLPDVARVTSHDSFVHYLPCNMTRSALALVSTLTAHLCSTYLRICICVELKVDLTSIFRIINSDFRFCSVLSLVSSECKWLV